MALQQEHQLSYNEQVALIADTFSGIPLADRPIRDDKPELADRYRDLCLIADGYDRELARVRQELRGMEIELMPDEERERKAEIARKLRDGDEFEDMDPTPCTPCPAWCNEPDHTGGAGQWHLGAFSHIAGINLQGGEEAPHGQSLLTYVGVQSGKPHLFVSGEAYLDLELLRTYVDGLLDAGDLYERLAAEADVR